MTRLHPWHHTASRPCIPCPWGLPQPGCSARPSTCLTALQSQALGPHPHPHGLHAAPLPPQIEKVDLKNEGVYTCAATNLAGESKRTVALKVLGEDGGAGWRVIP